MKHPRSPVPTLPALLAAAALALSAPALASGDHAGGHDHGAGAGGGDASAIGRPGVAAKVSRTLNIDMSDAMRFTPAQLSVRPGETVRLRVRNTGQVPHELTLGRAQDLLAHRDQMARHPGMTHHDEPGQLTLAPGQQGEIVWQFTQPGSVPFACLIPGHFEAGMKGVIQVASGAHP